MLLLSRDPLSDIGRATEEFSSLLLARAQKANHMNVHNRDFFQVQSDFGTTVTYLVDNLAEMLRPRVADKADDRSFSNRTSFELQHRSPWGKARAIDQQQHLNWL